MTATFETAIKISAFDNASPAISAATRSIARLNQTSDKAGIGFAGIEAAFSGFNRRIASIGTSLAASITVPAIAGLTVVLSKLGDVDKAFTNLQKGMAFDPSNLGMVGELKSMQEIARKMRQEGMGTDTNNLMMLDEANRSGLSGDRLAQSARTFAAYGAAAGVDGKKAVNELNTAAIQSLTKLEESNSAIYNKVVGRIANSYVAIANATRTSASGIAEGNKSALPGLMMAAGGKNNLSLEERLDVTEKSAALIGEGASRGFQDGEIGRAIKAFSARFAKLTPKALDALYDNKFDISKFMKFDESVMNADRVVANLKRTFPGITKAMVESAAGQAKGPGDYVQNLQKNLAEKLNVKGQDATVLAKKLTAGMLNAVRGVDVIGVLQAANAQGLGPGVMANLLGVEHLSKGAGFDHERFATILAAAKAAAVRSGMAPLEAAAEAQKRSFESLKSKFSGAFENFSASVFEAIGPQLHAIAGQFSQLLDGVSRLARDFPAATVAIMKTVAVAALLGPALLIGSFALRTMAFAIAPVIAGLRLLGGTFAAVALMARGSSLLPVAAFAAAAGGLAMIGGPRVLAGLERARATLGALATSMRTVGGDAMSLLDLYGKIDDPVNGSNMASGKNAERADDQRRERLEAFKQQLREIRDLLSKAAGEFAKDIFGGMAGGQKFGLLASSLALLATRSRIATAALRGVGVAMLSLGRIGAGVAVLARLPATLTAISATAAAAAVAFAPMAIGVAAVASLGAVIWNQWEKVGPIFVAAGKAGSEALGQLGDAIGKVGQGDFSGAWSSLVSAAGKAAKAIGLAFNGVSAAVNAQLKASLGIDLAPIWNGVTDGVAKFTASFAAQIDFDGLGKQLQSLFAPFRNIGQDVLAGVTAIGTMADSVSKLAGFSGAGEAVSSVIGSLGTALGRLSNIGLTGVAGAFQMLASALTTISAIGAGVGKFLSSLAEGKGLNSAMADGAAAFMTRIERAADLARKALEAFTGAWSKAFGAPRDMFGKALDSVAPNEGAGLGTIGGFAPVEAPKLPGLNLKPMPMPHGLDIGERFAPLAGRGAFRIELPEPQVVRETKETFERLPPWARAASKLDEADRMPPLAKMATAPVIVTPAAPNISMPILPAQPSIPQIPGAGFNFSRQPVKSFAENGVQPSSSLGGTVKLDAATILNARITEPVTTKLEGAVQVNVNVKAPEGTTTFTSASGPVKVSSSNVGISTAGSASAP